MSCIRFVSFVCCSLHWWKPTNSRQHNSPFMLCHHHPLSQKQVRCPRKATFDGPALVRSCFIWTARRFSILSSRADPQQRSLDYQRDNLGRRGHLPLPCGFQELARPPFPSSTECHRWVSTLCLTHFCPSHGRVNWPETFTIRASRCDDVILTLNFYFTEVISKAGAADGSHLEVLLLSCTHWREGESHQSVIRVIRCQRARFPTWRLFALG